MADPAGLLLRPATAADIELICRLNQQLKDDERARTRLPWEELVARLEGWLANDGYEAALFELGGEAVGYVLFRREPDPCRIGGEMMYLRQFFVCREFRRRGIGRRALELWRERCVPAGMPIEMDVLESNPGGRAFWLAVGMTPRATRMRRESP